VAKWPSVAADAFLAGAHSIGIPPNNDYNGKKQLGIGLAQSSIYQNKRFSTAHAFLHPAVRAFDVRVITRATVTSITFAGRRAIGLRYLGANLEAREVGANLGVIVCAGAIGSPKLLQLSGVGNAEYLSRLGIPVIHDLPGVGENLRDHYVARVVVRARSNVVSVNERVTGLALAREVIDWALRRPSVLALSPVLVYGFWKSRTELATPDFALSYFPASYKSGMIGYLDDQPGLTCGGFQLRPESVGHVRIQSPDHTSTPHIQPNFLAHPEDQKVIVAALKCARAVMNSEPMQALVQSETLPGASVVSDADWLEYARQFGSTAYHVVGTCKMGPTDDPLAVVDHRLRVHGLENLHVMDASVMPTIPSANTAAATIAIAEKGADMLRQA
jgi:choline dehydrogenase